jgi:hypothetical protein
MANFTFTVGEIISQIKKQGKMDIAHLGTDADQSTYIMYYMNLAAWKYVGLVYKKRTTDALVVAASGYVNFKIDGVDIEDFYAPIRLFITDTEGKVFKRRTSSDDTSSGWFKESFNDPIHIRGAGTYMMQYRAFTTKITAVGQALDWPATSYDLLMFETIGKIKESLNDESGAAAAYAVADKLIPILVKANMDSSQSSTGGVVPSQNEVQYYRR